MSNSYSLASKQILENIILIDKYFRISSKLPKILIRKPVKFSSSWGSHIATDKKHNKKMTSTPHKIATSISNSKTEH